MEKHSVDSKTAAEILGFKEQTLRSWRSTGKLKIPFVRFGRAVRYRMEDLQAFIVQNRVSQ